MKFNETYNKYILQLLFESDDIQTYLDVGHYGYKRDKQGNYEVVEGLPKVYLWFIDKKDNLQTALMKRNEDGTFTEHFDHFKMGASSVCGRFDVKSNNCSATFLANSFDRPEYITKSHVENTLKEKFGQNIKVYWL